MFVEAMNEPTAIHTPVDRAQLARLRAGDTVLITGDVLVFRDQVHRELAALLAAGKPLPVDLRDAVVYYCGPTPSRGRGPVGAAGPTTSSRMDPFTPPLLDAGIAAAIGKGDRSPEIARAFAKHGAVYFAATGGAGALLGRTVMEARVLAFAEFGPEALRTFRVRDFPAVVGIDALGNSAFAVPDGLVAGKTK